MSEIPDLVRQQIDQLVDKNQGMVATFMGIPMSRFSKDELLALINEQGIQMQQMHAQHRQSMRFMQQIARPQP